MTTRTTLWRYLLGKDVEVALVYFDEPVISRGGGPLPRGSVVREVGSHEVYMNRHRDHLFTRTPQGYACKVFD